MVLLTQPNAIKNQFLAKFSSPGLQISQSMENGNTELSQRKDESVVVERELRDQNEGSNERRKLTLSKKQSYKSGDRSVKSEHRRICNLFFYKMACFFDQYVPEWTRRGFRLPDIPFAKSTFNPLSLST